MYGKDVLKEYIFDCQIRKLSKRTIKTYKINISLFLDFLKIARSTVNKWISDYNNIKSFKANDNRSDEENELIKLRKENQRLKMENDILKQILSAPCVNY
ncbi:hypothetical protein SAMN02744040_01011 [Tepidibacter thalassicus DSM 15285]|uniref:Phage integrase, N-terminal SAM-like domain n=1 Tax=Tepidibacter thalassicus DSM 15285 TaxID=1123350 RepID=A0A1M5QKY4_9FIRM|nr:hypothetical protein SAMN02744040_01011 [Tepidibacter thalassicus DSM 15285]